MLVIATYLFLIGLCLGSFVNALVWRLHEQSKPKSKKSKSSKLSILNGRSICPDCKHQLAWFDLIPLLSWVILGGKCRYCRKPISRQYPIVELGTGLVFAISYLLWPFTLHLSGQWLILATWLAASVGLMALAVYDLKWMLLPNRIIYPTLAIVAVGRAVYIILFADRPFHAVFLWLFSLLIASGVFLALFIYSKGKWIGYGDVRLGLILGTLLADPQKSLAMIFIASLGGSLIALPGLINGKQKMTAKLPYGPFLIGATAVMVIYGDSLLNWYKNLII